LVRPGFEPSTSCMVVWLTQPTELTGQVSLTIKTHSSFLTNSESKMPDYIKVRLFFLFLLSIEDNLGSWDICQRLYTKHKKENWFPGWYARWTFSIFFVSPRNVCKSAKDLQTWYFLSMLTSPMCATIQLVHVSSSGYWRFFQNGKTSVSLFKMKFLKKMKINKLTYTMSR